MGTLLSMKSEKKRHLGIVLRTLLPNIRRLRSLVPAFLNLTWAYIYPPCWRYLRSNNVIMAWATSVNCSSSGVRSLFWCESNCCHGGCRRRAKSFYLASVRVPSLWTMGAFFPALCEPAPDGGQNQLPIPRRHCGWQASAFCLIPDGGGCQALRRRLLQPGAPAFYFTCYYLARACCYAFRPLPSLPNLFFWRCCRRQPGWLPQFIAFPAGYLIADPLRCCSGVYGWVVFWWRVSALLASELPHRNFVLQLREHARMASGHPITQLTVLWLCGGQRPVFFYNVVMAQRHNYSAELRCSLAGMRIEPSCCLCIII